MLLALEVDVAAAGRERRGPRLLLGSALLHPSHDDPFQDDRDDRHGDADRPTLNEAETLRLREGGTTAHVDPPFVSTAVGVATSAVASSGAGVTAPTATCAKAR